MVKQLQQSEKLYWMTIRMRLLFGKIKYKITN